MAQSHLLRTLPVALAAVAASASGVQSPRAEWRTIATAHYRIHYPPVMADWAQDVASRIEGIHTAVVGLVGYESPKPVHVLLVDPMSVPNGMAMPLLPYPYVTLWRTEPRSDDLHGNALASWTEELVSHEMTHIHHLTRPTRPATVLSSLFELPIGPLVLKCPRWVTEGYATLAEGRLTGSGRPHSALRAALLRQWARDGMLPAYEGLDNAGGLYGGNLAYLVGSAYLEWLERQRPGQPDLLRNFWKQLASRKGRSFDAAFLATFGFSPQDGYRRFTAETAHDALEWETRLKAQGLREGEILLRAGGALRNLEVSPDGTRILASMEGRGALGLRVWNLGQEKKKPGKAPRPDPLNGVADVAPDVPSRRPAAELPLLDHRLPQEAAWVDDHTIRFRIRRADSEGVQHLQPALWRLPGGVETGPGTLPPARWKGLEPVHRAGLWVLELDGKPVPLPGHPIGRAFLDEGRGILWAACEVEGIFNIVKVPFTREGGQPRFQEAQVMTRTVAGAWNPAPSPDGRTLYFTTPDARGMELRKLDLGLPPLQAGPAPEVRIINPRTVMAPPLETVTMPRQTGPLPSVPYRALDNQWVQMGSGATLTPSGTSYQMGVSGSDLLGRFSWHVLGGFGDAAGPRGAVAGFSSSAWAWKPSLSLFSVLERPSRQRFEPRPGDRERRGGELAFTWDNLGETPFWFSPVVAAERVEALDGAGGTRTRSLAGLRAGAKVLWARGGWGVSVSPAVQWFPGRTTGDGSGTWNLLRSDLAVLLENPAVPLKLRASGGRIANGAGSTAPEAFRLGGVTTSLVPESLDCGRIEQVALPSGLAAGDRFFRWRGEAGGILRAYLEGTSVWSAGLARGPYQRVAGVEFAMDNPLGIASEDVLKRMRIEAGVHRPLDGVMKRRTVATFTVILRP